MFLSAMDTARKPSAEQRLASLINISVDDLNNSLDPSEESPTLHSDVQCFPQLLNKVATDDFWESRG